MARYNGSFANHTFDLALNEQTNTLYVINRALNAGLFILNVTVASNETPPTIISNYTPTNSDVYYNQIILSRNGTIAYITGYSQT
jgi:hypothetical protein